MQETSSSVKNLKRQGGFFSMLPTAWFLGIFSLGLVLMSVYNHFVIKSQIKALLENTENDLDVDGYQFLPMDILKRLKVNSLREVQDSRSPKRAKRQAGIDFAAAHLIGDNGRNVRDHGSHQRPQYGNYFRWTSRGEKSFSLLELDESDNRGTLIVINKNGYYLVYSQVLYYGHGLYRVGHETVRISHDLRYTLMTTLATQQLSTPSSDRVIRGRSVDSGFHAGLFYLYSGDRLGVKPTNYRRNHTMGATASYFGACFLWDWKQ